MVWFAFVPAPSLSHRGFLCHAGGPLLLSKQGHTYRRGAHVRCGMQGLRVRVRARVRTRVGARDRVPVGVAIGMSSTLYVASCLAFLRGPTEDLH